MNKIYATLDLNKSLKEFKEAEIILHARCQWIAGCWNKFCDSILTALLKPIQIG